MSRRRPDMDSRRVRPRWWWRSILAGAIITTLVLGGQWILHQPFFKVRSVSVSGNIHETRLDVIAQAGLATPVAMIDLNEANISRRLSLMPWVARAVVSRQWPHSVNITITERHPVAIAARGSRYELVAEDGVDLGLAPTGTNLPLLIGSVGGWPYTGSARNLVTVAATLPRAFSAQVATISQRPESGIRLTMTTPVTFILGPATDLPAKYEDVAAVLAHENLTAGDVVDVTVPSAVAISGP